MAELSPREAQVIRLYANGFGTAEIAEKLCLSGKTIESHRARVKTKMKINSGVEWMRLLRQFPMDEEVSA
jgi:DNA-binding CsgD family transcriptional regulator